MAPAHHNGAGAVIHHQHQAGTPDQAEGNALVLLRKGYLRTDAGGKTDAVRRFLGLHVRCHQQLPQVVCRARQFQTVRHLVKQLPCHAGISRIDQQGKHFQSYRHAFRLIPAGSCGGQDIRNRQAGPHGPLKTVGKPAVLHFRESIAQNIQSGVRITGAQMAASA